MSACNRALDFAIPTRTGRLDRLVPTDLQPLPGSPTNANVYRGLITGGVVRVHGPEAPIYVYGRDTLVGEPERLHGAGIPATSSER
jgi:hypothetical protein